MNAYDIAQTKKLIPLTDEEFELINEKGISTGSYVFGGFIKGISDIDIIFHNFDITEIKDYDKKIYVPDNDSSKNEISIKSVYALGPEKYPLNLLFIKEDKELYKEWKRAARLMIKLKKIPKLARQFEDKKQRILMFEFLKDNFV